MKWENPTWEEEMKVWQKEHADALREGSSSELKQTGQKEEWMKSKGESLSGIIKHTTTDKQRAEMLEWGCGI